MGKVIGTQDATPLDFWVLLDKGEAVQVDEAVVVEADSPIGPLKLFGMIDVIRARHQGSTFDSDVVEAERGLPVELSIAAHVKVTRLDPEYYYPPLPGNLVRVVSGEEYARALFMDKMERKFPLGLSLSRKEVVYGNLDFLNGRKGAHVNISGISGIATKTTYSTFLLHSLLHCGALHDSTNTHAIIFNVKGEDLLFLDKHNNTLTPEDLVEYEKLGLPAEPFDSVQFYVPPTETPRGPIMPKVGARRAAEVTPYFWTVRSFCRDKLLRYLFADAGEDSSLLSTLVYQVERRLSEAAEEAEKQGPGPGIFLRIEKKSKGEKGAEEEPNEVGEEKEIRDFPSLMKAIEVIAGSTGQATGTVGAFMRRLYGTEDKISYVIRDPDDAEPAKHTSEGWSPIRERLLEIAERGRSSGTILIGAQQTASEVERRIIANPAFRIVGRLDAAEAERAEYGFLPPTLRQRATILTSGRMIVSQPDIPTPVPVCFPMPAWATRAEEQELPPPNLKLVKTRRGS